MDKLVLTAKEAAARLDKFISENSEISRSFASKLIEDGSVLINGREASKKTKVNINDEVEITFDEPEELEAKPENIPIDIVYEDDSVIVVN